MPLIGKWEPSMCLKLASLRIRLSVKISPGRACWKDVPLVSGIC